MTAVPRVSVCIPTHNRLAYLREAIGSVLSQSYVDFELVICDDASDDGTSEYCKALIGGEPRARLVRHASNVGMAANWQAGLDAARGHYYAKLDDDNRWLPEFLERTVGALECHSECDFVTTDEWFIDENGTRDPVASDAAALLFGRTAMRTGPQPDTPLFATQRAFGINASLFRRRAVFDAGGYLARAGHASDTALFLHLAARGAQAYFIADRLEEYRVHGVRSTAQTLADLRKAEEAVWLWRSVQYTGAAEKVRRAALAEVEMNLARVLSLHGHVSEARRAALRAFRVRPLRPKTWAALGLLCLPMRLRTAVLDRRYTHQRA